LVDSKGIHRYTEEPGGNSYSLEFENNLLRSLNGGVAMHCEDPLVAALNQANLGGKPRGSLKIKDEFVFN
jgi:hypothetical protein